MTLIEIVQKLVVIIDRFEGCAIPTYMLDAHKVEARAGEPALALEDFCAQLVEYDVPVSRDTRDELRDLGILLELPPTLWTDLIVQ